MHTGKRQRQPLLSCTCMPAVTNRTQMTHFAILHAEWAIVGRLQAGKISCVPTFTVRGLQTLLLQKSKGWSRQTDWHYTQGDHGTGQSAPEDTSTMNDYDVLFKLNPLHSHCTKCHTKRKSCSIQRQCNNHRKRYINVKRPQKWSGITNHDINSTWKVTSLTSCDCRELRESGKMWLQIMYKLQSSLRMFTKTHWILGIS